MKSNFQKIGIEIPVEIPVNFMILTGTGIPANRLILTGTGILPGSRSILAHKVLFIADLDEKYNLTALNSISISVIQPEVNIGKLERMDVYI